MVFFYKRKEWFIIFAKSIKNHPTLKFILKTVFYFIIILLLIYLYGYYGAGQEPFIYNEF